MSNQVQAGMAFRISSTTTFLVRSRDRHRRLRPGGENAHGANEAVFVADLVTQAKVSAETITRLLAAA